MTELEYEKSCRGNQNPAANEFAWGNTSATALTGLSNASNMSETASSSSSNIAYNNSFTTGPVRTGIFATGSTSRATSGSGYYGNMELSGNLWERVVTVGNATGRAFSGVHGNGTLTATGASDVSGWPAAAGTGWKGGSWLNTTTNSATTSDRAQSANTDNTRSADAGGRGVRTVSPGIVTDGLVLWLDASNKPSYPESGTTWIDLSGNNNNGTLTNGPTFNSSNEGSIVFDGVNDYISLPTNFISWVGGIPFTISVWFKTTSTGIIFGQQNGPIPNSTNSYIPAIYVDTNGLLRTTCFYSGTLQTSVSSSAVNNGAWNKITVTFLSGIQTSYLNGISYATLSQTQVGYSGSYFYFLGSGQGNNWTATPASPYYNGSISNFSYYNRALTAAEVLQNFNAQKSRFGL
jgi:hypothetical protein